MDLLKRKKLVLINPAFWEDYDDQATVKIFQKLSKKEGVYALCLNDQNETIRHWKALKMARQCEEYSWHWRQK